MSFVLVERTKSKARIALTGPTNVGKSYTALLIAFGITGDWKKIAFVDTERGRGKFYANRTDLPYPTGQFYYMELKPPYTPDKYIDAFKEAEKLVGPDGVIIGDSLSHAWAYSGGVLDQHQEISKQSGKTSYTAWNEAGKIQNDLIDTILAVNCHTIVTMRSKMDYVLEENDQGKKVPKKVGLAPIQRNDTEYEFDITLMLNNDHKATIIKDTTFLGAKGSELEPITPEFGRNLIKWLDEGVDPAEFKEQERLANIKRIQELAKQHGLSDYYKNLIDKKTVDLTLEESKIILEKFLEVIHATN